MSILILSVADNIRATSTVIYPYTVLLFIKDFQELVLGVRAGDLGWPIPFQYCHAEKYQGIPGVMITHDLPRTNSYSHCRPLEHSEVSFHNLGVNCNWIPPKRYLYHWGNGTWRWTKPIHRSLMEVVALLFYRLILMPCKIRRLPLILLITFTVTGPTYSYIIN